MSGVGCGFFLWLFLDFSIYFFPFTAVANLLFKRHNDFAETSVSNGVHIFEGFCCWCCWWLRRDYYKHFALLRMQNLVKLSPCQCLPGLKLPKRTMLFNRENLPFPTAANKCGLVRHILDQWCFQYKQNSSALNQFQWHASIISNLQVNLSKNISHFNDKSIWQPDNLHYSTEA